MLKTITTLFSARWQQFQPREKKIVGILLITIFGFIIYSLTLPTLKKISKLESQLSDTRQQAGQVFSMLEQIKKFKKNQNSSVLSGDEQKTQITALLTQFNLKPVDPNLVINDQGLSIAFDQADYGAVLSWLQMLHTQFQLRVIKADVISLGEGKVKVNVQLSRVQAVL